jgi:hypothetical protein
LNEDGHRRLLTENEARAALPAEDALAVLSGLEKAAVLHAEEHHGGRYFQLGHDWLAARVFKLRQEREREEEAAGRLATERAARRRLGVIAGIAVVVAVVMAVLVVWALRERDTARTAEDRARVASLVAGVRELLARGQPAPAARLLLKLGQGLFRGVQPRWQSRRHRLLGQDGAGLGQLHPRPTTSPPCRHHGLPLSRDAPNLPRRERR